MALPSNASVEATSEFLSHLESAGRFFLEQDADSAPGRLADLKASLREMTEILSWAPANGRPARFYSATSAQAQLRLEAVLRLAEQAGLPHLREYVIGTHVVLYAHSESRVVLLALKHQRQLGYDVL